MDAFEKILSDALRFTDATDPKKRMKVYQNVAKAIETVPEQKRELYRTKLAAFIRKFEAELQDAQPAISGKLEVETPARAPDSPSAPQMTSPEFNDQAGIEPPMSDVTPDDLSDATVDASSVEERAVTPRTLSSRYLVFTVAITAAILLTFFAVWYFQLDDNGRKDTTNSPKGQNRAKPVQQ